VRAVSARPSGEKRAIIAAVIGGLAFAGIALAAQSGCQLQGTCAPTSAWWPPPTPSNVTGPVPASLPSSGTYDDNDWQSSGLDDTWLDFPGGRTYTIFPFTTSQWQSSPRFYGPYTGFDIDVATDPQPTTTGNFTPASGNLAEVFLVSDPSPSQFAAQQVADAAAVPPSFNIVNATCADYYLRVVVHRDPTIPDTVPVPDAGAD
jgi:hypothetical protein